MVAEGRAAPGARIFEGAAALARTSNLMVGSPSFDRSGRSRTKTRTRSLSSSLPPRRPTAGEAGRGESTREVAGEDSVAVAVRGVCTITCDGANGGFCEWSRLESVRCCKLLSSFLLLLLGEGERATDFLRFTGDGGGRDEACPGEPLLVGMAVDCGSRRFSPLFSPRCALALGVPQPIQVLYLPLPPFAKNTCLLLTTPFHPSPNTQHSFHNKRPVPAEGP